MTSPPDETLTEPVDVVDDGDVMDSDWTEDKPRRTGTLTKVLVGLLLVALGFLGGVAVGRSAGGTAPAGGSSAGSSGGGGGGGGGAATSGTTGGGAGAGGSTANPGAGSSVAPSAANGPGAATPRSSFVAPPTVVVTQPQAPAPAGAQPNATANSGARVGSTPTTIANGSG